MVQTTLFFLLGFLAAAFIACAIAPAIWRRAGELTRRRIEASMPLTLNEVQADKDQQRAEFAISLRKVEIKAKALQEKLTGQRAEAATQREKARVLTEERAAQDAELLVRANNLTSLKSELTEREQDISFLGNARTELENQISVLNTNIESRDKSIADLNVEIDSQRIELAAKATDQDRMTARINELNQLRKNLEEKFRLANAEARTVREAARTDAKRVADLERKSERLITQLSDREERLERREKELLRIKDGLKAATDEQLVLKRQMQAFKQAMQPAAASAQSASEASAKLDKMAAFEAAEKMKKLENDKARLEAMVAQLNDEKAQLVQRLKAAVVQPAQTGPDDAKLRAQVHDLTAKIVSLTAEKEGPQSPVTRLLHRVNDDTAAVVNDVQEDKAELPESLAERIKALQKSARSG